MASKMEWGGAWAIRLCMAICVCGAAVAQASVVITGTRVVYPQSEREVTVRVNNDGKAPSLVQTWLDNGDPDVMPDEEALPFAVVPPLFRLDGNKGQSLRLIHSGEEMPDDRESLFWLNVLEVPSQNKAVDDSNQLRFAFRSRIKVFFRPTGLSGDARDAAAQVAWQFVELDSGGYGLQASNPTPYHVTFSSVRTQVGGQSLANDAGGMVKPGDTQTFLFENLKALPPGNPQVDYTFIDDYGAGVQGHAGAAESPAAAQQAD